MQKIQYIFLRCIFGISLVAMLGSLYVGYRGDPFINWETGHRFNRLNSIPACDMCRYMRIFQYPLVILSLIGIITKDKHAFLYIRPLAVIGLFFAIYKLALEQGWATESQLCTNSVSCSTPTYLGGFLSLPLSGGIAFLCILLLCIIGLYGKKHTH